MNPPTREEVIAGLFKCPDFGHIPVGTIWKVPRWPDFAPMPPEPVPIPVLKYEKQGLASIPGCDAWVWQGWIWQGEVQGSPVNWTFARLVGREHVHEFVSHGGAF